MELKVESKIMDLVSIIMDGTMDENHRYQKVEKILLENKKLVNEACPSLLGESYLHLAVKYNRVDILLLLLSLGADVNAVDNYNETALHYAAEKGLKEMVFLLCYYKADATILSTLNQESALHVAAKKDHINCIKILLSMQTSINPLLPNIKGETARELMKHSTTHSESELQQLFSDDYQGLGRTALHYAVLYNFPKAVALLLAQGEPINKPDKNLNTALHYAALNGFIEILLILCNHPDINMNSINIDGDTALHSSVKSMNHGGLRILVNNHKPIHRELRNKGGKTAEELILEVESDNIKQNLKKSFYSIPPRRMTLDYETGLFSKAPRKSSDEQLTESVQGNIKSLKLANPQYDDEEKKPAKVPLLKMSSSKRKSEDRPTIRKVPSITEKELSQFKSYEKEKKNFDSLIVEKEKELRIPLLEYGLEQSYSVSEVKLLTDEEFVDLGKRLNENVFNNSSLLSSSEVVPHRVKSLSGPIQIVKTECFQAVYYACMGKREEDKLKIDMDDIYINTVGLLAYYKPHEIVHALSLLGNHFSNHQYLIGSIIVKNILLLSFEFGYNLSTKAFNNAFLNYLANNCLKNISSILKDIKETAEKFQTSSLYSDHIDFISKPLNYQSHDMEKISERINKTINSKSNIRDEAKFLAVELNNLTAAFYQKCTLGDYVSNKDGKDSALLVAKQQELFNALTAYIQYQILTRPTAKLRAKAITLFVLAAKECLHYYLGQELNSIFAIFSSLASPPIARLTKTFALLDSKILIDLESIKKIVNPSGNYKFYRDFSKAFPKNMPFLGFIIGQNILIKEGSPPYKAISFLGEHYSPLIDLRKRLEFHTLINKSDLCFQLINSPKLNDRQMDKLSYFAEPMIPDLTISKTPCSVDQFCFIFNKFKQYQHQLMVIDNKKVFEGEKALDKIRQWLEYMEKTSQIDAKRAQEIELDCYSFLKSKAWISYSQVLSNLTKDERSSMMEKTAESNDIINSPRVSASSDAKDGESPISSPRKQEKVKTKTRNHNRGSRFFASSDSNNVIFEVKEETKETDKKLEYSKK